MVTRMRKCPPVPVAPSTFFQRKKKYILVEQSLKLFFFNLKKNLKKKRSYFWCRPPSLWSPNSWPSARLSSSGRTATRSLLRPNKTLGGSTVLKLDPSQVNDTPDSPSGLICGWYVVDVPAGSCAALRFHTLTPSAAPAAMAAPRAVVSGIAGFTGQQRSRQRNRLLRFISTTTNALIQGTF